MNSTQMGCLQKLINALQDCERAGVTFSYASILINVEDEQSHYLEYLSSGKLSELLNFIDGCGACPPKKVSAMEVMPDDLNDTADKSFYMMQDTSIGYDNGSRVGDYSCAVEIKDGVVTKWEVTK